MLIRTFSGWFCFCFLGFFCRQAGGPVDAGPEFQKEMNESLARLQRAYGGGDLTKFPEFKFEGE